MSTPSAGGRDDDAPDPFDYYDEYSEWLIRNYPICNGDQLVLHLESATGFEQFLSERAL